MRDLLSYITDGAVIVGSLGTAGALIVAARSYQRSGDIRRREQASKVYALPVSTQTSEGEDGSWRWDPFEATITNVSDMPAQNVRIALYDCYGGRVAGRVIPMLAAHSETEPIPFPSSAAAPPGEDLAPGSIPLLQLKLVDSTGLEWVREPDGELREIR